MEIKLNGEVSIFPVLIITGKREEIASAKIKIFIDKTEAEEFCLFTSSDPDEKYWTLAKLVEENEEYELGKYSIIKN